jgi:DNA modification methylase
MTINILQGNCLETLKTLPAESVQMVVTSPPYYGLRDYGAEGQIGLEPTPEAYVENLVAVFRECRRVLKGDGVLWLNLGDSYAGGGNYRGISSEETLSEKQRSNRGARGVSQLLGAKNTPGCKPKDLIGIPWMVAFALRADGWYLRQDIIWAKPNPMPESVTDRCTKSHEYIFLLSKSGQYYYDADAIKEPSVEANWQSRLERKSTKSKPTEKVNGIRDRSQSFKRNNPACPDIPGQLYGQHRSGRVESEYDLSLRNKRDVWTVTTKPYKEAHFATFPPDLIEPCILAGSREGDTVLDPFNGSGTSGEVSIKHHRNYIGCELNPAYVELTYRRLSQVQPVLLASSALTPRAADNGTGTVLPAFVSPEMFPVSEG